METVLEVKQLSKNYRKQTVLNNLNIKIELGDIYGLVGRNGAGKTTLLKSIVQMVTPTNGQILLFGKEINQRQLKQLSRVGSIIEEANTYENLTARQNLQYFCKLEGIVDENVVDETLRYVGLHDTEGKKFKHFSMGMKQKLGLAIALLKRPDFLILDEPINGLDPVAIAEFRELLKKLNRDSDTTILISSHILEELYHVATKFGFLKNGQIVKELTKEEFEEQSTEFVKIESPNVYHVAEVLTSNGIQDFKVVEDDIIHLYDLSVSVQEVNELLVREKVHINAIQKEGKNLENYFRDLIGE